MLILYLLMLMAPPPPPPPTLRRKISFFGFNVISMESPWTFFAFEIFWLNFYFFCVIHKNLFYCILFIVVMLMACDTIFNDGCRVCVWCNNGVKNNQSRHHHGLFKTHSKQFLLQIFKCIWGLCQNKLFQHLDTLLVDFLIARHDCLATL